MTVIWNTRRRPRFPPAAGTAAALLLLAAAGLLVCVLAAAAATAESELEFGLQQHLLQRIELRGNVAVPAADLKAVMKIREKRSFHPLAILGFDDRGALYQPHLLDAELRLLTRYYRQRGFHQVSVQLDSVQTDVNERGDVLHISIVEGPQTFLDVVEVVIADTVEPVADGEAADGDEMDVLDPDKLLADLHYVAGVAAPADLNDLGTDIYLLRTRLWERGHMLAQIRPVMTTSATADPARRGPGRSRDGRSPAGFPGRRLGRQLPGRGAGRSAGRPPPPGAAARTARPDPARGTGLAAGRAASRPAGLAPARPAGQRRRGGRRRG